MMNDDRSAATVPDKPVRRVRSEAGWLALVADFESWDGSQVSFCESRGVCEVVSGRTPQARPGRTGVCGQARRLRRDRNRTAPPLTGRSRSRRDSRSSSARCRSFGGRAATQPTAAEEFVPVCTDAAQHTSRTLTALRWTA